MTETKTRRKPHSALLVFLCVLWGGLFASSRPVLYAALFTLVCVAVARLLDYLSEL